LLGSRAGGVIPVELACNTDGSWKGFLFMLWKFFVFVVKILARKE
jgi:hypothetical protein